MTENSGNKNLTGNAERELLPLVECLKNLKDEGKILVAVLFGSYARGEGHVRSDIDFAVFMAPLNWKDEVLALDAIHMSVDRSISLLRLDDADESPFVIQAALKGIHLVEPDEDALFGVADRVLHESEDIRHRRYMLTMEENCTKTSFTLRQTLGKQSGCL